MPSPPWAALEGPHPLQRQERLCGVGRTQKEWVQWWREPSFLYWKEGVGQNAQTPPRKPQETMWCSACGRPDWRSQGDYAQGCEGSLHGRFLPQGFRLSCWPPLPAPWKRPDIWQMLKNTVEWKTMKWMTSEHKRIYLLFCTVPRNQTGTSG